MTEPSGPEREFEYLLNAMELAGQHSVPSTQNYFGKRQAVFAYVARLRAELAAAKAEARVHSERCVELRTERDHAQALICKRDAALESARKAQRDGWIAVSERLPDEHGASYVLTITSGRKINPAKNKPFGERVGIGLFSREWPGSKQRDYWAISDEAGNYFGCRWLDADSIAIWGEVTHWQPLPDPPAAPRAQGEP